MILIKKNDIFWCAMWLEVECQLDTVPTKSKFLRHFYSPYGEHISPPRGGDISPRPNNFCVSHRFVKDFQRYTREAVLYYASVDSTA